MYPLYREKQEHQLLKRSPQSHHPKPTFVSTPPPSPMTATLGQPNRSCASCKKRKVKCDRKTPSCSACQKSKHHCHYTSYSPTVFTEETQFSEDDERIRALKQRVEEIDTARQRWENLMKSLQPVLTAKYLNPSQPEDRKFPLPTYYGEDEFYNLGFENPSSPTLPVNVQYPLQPTLINMPYQSPYVVSPIPPTSPATSGDYAPYMRATVTLNYNLNAMQSLLGPEIAPFLQSVTSGDGSMIPSSGFPDAAHLQNWLQSKFMSQSWNDEMESVEEKFELRPIFNESGCQRFEVIMYRVEYAPSTASVHESDNLEYQQTEDFGTFDDCQYVEGDEKRCIDFNNYYASCSNSNRSSVVSEADPADIFINKIYSFVRRFKKSVLWLGENFLANSLARSEPALIGFPTSDGVFTDVAVEVRPVNHHHISAQIPGEVAVKGRLFF